MRERQARIDAGLEKERAANAEAAENEKRIEDAKTQRREEAKAILAKQRTDDGRAHEECAKQLLKDSAKERQEARVRVEAMAKDAKAKLDTEKDELANALAERLISK